MKIDIIAGVTPCPFVYPYDGSLGDDPTARIELRLSDGSYAYDYGVRISHAADDSTFTIIAQPGDDGKFQDNYVLILTPAAGAATRENTFPFTLPYILQF